MPSKSLKQDERLVYEKLLKYTVGETLIKVWHPLCTPKTSTKVPVIVKCISFAYKEKIYRRKRLLAARLLQKRVPKKINEKIPKAISEWEKRFSELKIVRTTHQFQMKIFWCKIWRFFHPITKSYFNEFLWKSATENSYEETKANNRTVMKNDDKEIEFSNPVNKKPYQNSSQNIQWKKHTVYSIRTWPITKLW